MIKAIFTPLGILIMVFFIAGIFGDTILSKAKSWQKNGLFSSSSVGEDRMPFCNQGRPHRITKKSTTITARGHCWYQIDFFGKKGRFEFVHADTTTDGFEILHITGRKAEGFLERYKQEGERWTVFKGGAFPVTPEDEIVPHYWVRSTTTDQVKVVIKKT